MPSAYIIADAHVTDSVQYAEYRKLSTAAIENHGAEICVRGGKVEPIEGGWEPTRIVILKFASMERARAFYDSPEYIEARKVRAPASQLRMILVEGL